MRPCVRAQERELLLFIEESVPGGLEMLQDLGKQSIYSGFVENSFFAVGRSSYYGGYPLSFAAASGARAPPWGGFLVARRALACL